MQADQETATVSARAVLVAVGQELDGLGTQMDRVQDALSPAMSPALLAHPGAIAGLQELDRVGQTLRALSGVVARLSQNADHGWTLAERALLGDVTLSDLARRLAAPRADR